MFSLAHVSKKPNARPQLYRRFSSSKMTPSSSVVFINEAVSESQTSKRRRSQQKDAKEASSDDSKDDVEDVHGDLILERVLSVSDIKASADGDPSTKGQLSKSTSQEFLIGMNAKKNSGTKTKNVSLNRCHALTHKPYSYTFGKPVDKTQQVKRRTSFNFLRRNSEQPQMKNSLKKSFSSGSNRKCSHSKMFFASQITSSIVNLHGTKLMRAVSFGHGQKVDKMFFENYDFPMENLIFEGGGNKGMSYVGAIEVSFRILIYHPDRFDRRLSNLPALDKASMSNIYSYEFILFLVGFNDLILHLLYRTMLRISVVIVTRHFCTIISDIRHGSAFVVFTHFWSLKLLMTFTKLRLKRILEIKIYRTIRRRICF